ncbi:MAG: CHASE3 domain-containing protein [Terriglobales bacterium]
MTSLSKAIVAFVLILMAGIGMLSYHSQIRNEMDRMWVRHTYQVLEALQTLRIDITQAETGQRDFMLTGEGQHLALYRAGVDKVNQDIKVLESLTSDNPRQQLAISRMEVLLSDRLAELAGGIDVRKKSGLEAGVEALAHQNHGELWMDLIATHIDEIRHTEIQLLNTRLDTATRSESKTKIVLLWGNALAIFILFVKGLVIHRETRRRNQADQDLRYANGRLERRTAELSETNIELESFAYSVAHDLRAPLRHIAGYSHMLQEDYGPRFDAEGLRRLGKIGEGAGQMGRLVDDLLNLSKIGRHKLLIQDTPLDSLLQETIEDFVPQCSGRKVEWQIGDLSSAKCDPGLMKQVFINLLSNAVKYTRKRDHAVIQVGQMEQNHERVIFVRDNGAGFEMQYADKLFGVFQRLHKACDFEGTGVGLAIVQRVIRKHGGRIWAEAELDHGATFFFTIGSPEAGTSPESHGHQETKLPIQEEEMHGAS